MRVTVNGVTETLVYPSFFLWLHIRPGAGGRVPVSAASMDCVFAACTTGHKTRLLYDSYTKVYHIVRQNSLEKNPEIINFDTTSLSDKCLCSVTLFWCAQVLTGAAQSLLPQTQQHALAHVAVNRLVEMFHPPKMLAVLLGHLVVEGTIIEAMGKVRGVRRALWFNSFATVQI